MPRLTIARSLLLALVGLTVVLAVVAALEVAALYDARQDYEDDLGRSYAGETAAANVVAAGVVEETILRSDRTDASAREQATAAFERAVGSAETAARGDEASARLIATIRSAQVRVRAQAAILRDLPPRARERRAAAGEELTAAAREGRRAAGTLAQRQAERRIRARDRAEERTDRALLFAVLAGALALVAAIALVSMLVAGLRRPLESLIGATRRLAGGDLETRVQPEGPLELQELGTSFNSMATDIETARERIMASSRRLSAVIESLGDALIICDGFGRIVQVNPRAEHLVPELALGRNVNKDPGPLPDLSEVLDKETEIVHDDRTLAVTAARMGPKLEDGVVFTVRDMSERARLERAKSDFVATASHELRSPLTSIKGFVELLATQELEGRQREFLDIILLSTNRLVDLVNDLLDVARVEAGQLEIQRRPIAIEQAVNEVVTLMRPRFADKGLTLDVDIAPALPVAHADPARMRQIVTNLVTNALLYTPEGGTVSVRVGATGEQVSIAVVDNGRGMTPDQVERAFERFYRGDGGPQGTGLGLSIVKSLVDLHEGTIDIASRPGEGTTVTIRVPRAPATADLSEPRLALRGRRVLVVDDEPEVARLIVEQLRPYEVETVVVHDGEAAMTLLRREEFDAVTLDILLGGMDGFEVLRTLREDAELRGIPVIVVSVMAGQDALSGEWSVTKPIDAEELTDAIGSAILAGRARVLVVGRASMRDVVGEMLERRGIDFEWATSGSEAGRLCEETHFEVALVDAGMRSPQAALAQLDLRGRRLRRSVVVFSTGDDAPGLARLGPDPVSVEDATQAVVDVLRASAGAPADQ